MNAIFAVTFVLYLYFPSIIAVSAPRITTVETDYYVDDGEEKRVITCHASGDPVPSIVWFWKPNRTDFVYLTKANDLQFYMSANASLVVNNSRSRQTYGLVRITCSANNTYGMNRTTFNIWLRKAPRILTNNSITNIGQLDTFGHLHLPCETTGYPEPHIQWKFGPHVRNASQGVLLGEKAYINPITGVAEVSSYVVYDNGTLAIEDLFTEKHLTYRNYTCVAQNVAGIDNRTHMFEILTEYKFEVILPKEELIDLESRVEKKIRSVFQPGKLFYSRKITSINETTGAVKFQVVWKDKNLRSIYDNPDRDFQQLANDVYDALVKGGLNPVEFVMNEKPPPPVVLTSSDIKSNRFTLSWDHPKHFRITSYQVQILEVSNNKWKNKNMVGATTSTLVDNLKPATKYQLRIYSINDRGRGPKPSEMFVVETKAASPAVTIIVVVVVVVIIAVLLVLGVVFYRRRKKSQDHDDSGSIIIPPENPYHDALPGVHFENIYISSGRTYCPSGDEGFFSWNEIPRNNLTFGDVLGKGEFGLVTKVIWHDDDTNNDVFVAVKTVQAHATETDRKELFKELQLMADIAEHPNVVNLVGACSQQGPLWVIVEFCEHGNLLSYLQKHRNTLSENENAFVSSVEPLTRVKFAYDVSKGMGYLEQKKIIHRDLAARNVLLGKNKVAKVSDFGLSRDIYEVGLYQKTTMGKLPVKWMAIESIQEATYTPKSDVWSFAVLLWEIETAGMVPYPGISGRDLLPYLLSGHRLFKPDSTSPEIYELMLTCWQASPKVRPSFHDLERKLEAYISDTTGYLPVIADEAGGELENAYVNYYMQQPDSEHSSEDGDEESKL